jgi:hypothetical protein
MMMSAADIRDPYVVATIDSGSHINALYQLRREAPSAECRC